MSESIPLNQANLEHLPAGVQWPQYDRSNLTAGIVHVGVGGFHRSHEAYYTDHLLAAGEVTDWAICGVGLREGDRKIADVLKEQDYLYTLIVKHPNGDIENKVIGSLIDFILGCDGPSAVIHKMASETTKIVSLTITEGGYNFNQSTGEFNFDHPDIIHDLAHPEEPRTIFGYLTESIRVRLGEGVEPFTVQSCDNIQHNGDVARKMVLAFANRQDPELGAYIEANVCFPNAMVDRITPVTTPEDMQTLESETGIIDAWPVTCEPFCQWVIEDKFSNTRPEWESVGAQFVPDVTPYETMKLRLLNAGHSVLGILGSIHGYDTIDHCVQDPLFAQYLRKFMDEEVTPILPVVEGIDLENYKDTLLERFANPSIRDSLVRICLESSSKLPVFLLPTITENLTQGREIKYGALVIAAWCYYSDKHADVNGNALEVIDELSEELQQAASGTSSDPLSFIKLTAVFGSLAEEKTFTEEYKVMVKSLYKNPNISELMQSIVS